MPQRDTNMIISSRLGTPGQCLMSNLFQLMQQRLAERQARAAEIRQVDPDKVERLDWGTLRAMSRRQLREAASHYETGICDRMAGDLSVNQRLLSNPDYQAGRRAGSRLQYRIMNKLGSRASNEIWARRLARIQVDHPVISGEALTAELAARCQADERRRAARQPLLQQLRQDLHQPPSLECPF